MDLNTIIMHLDNFVDTWEGWGKVLGGLFEVSSDRPVLGLDFVDAWGAAEEFSSFSSLSSDNQ